MRVQHFFDGRTSTLSYVAYDEASKVGVVIDPVLDFDPRTGRTFDDSLTALCDFVTGAGLEVPYVLETHTHADHFSGLAWLGRRFGARTVTGAKIGVVQRFFAQLYNLSPDFATDGRQFDRLLADGEVLDVGPFAIEAIATPGHTPACTTYRIDERLLFVGDALLMPDVGTARCCDFPGASAPTLHDSIQRLYRLPDETEVFTGHDDQPGGRALRFRTTIAEQRRDNVDAAHDVPKDAFVERRQRRDAALTLPPLMLAAIQVNIAAGELPVPERNGAAYLKLPLNRF